jgi:ribose/xylose/arabinose/galactoside ABC-type transport system permease subunit
MHLHPAFRQQETIVAVLTAILFVAFALAIPDFIAPANLLNIARSVAPLGILALGMAVVVIGRGIDLSMVGVLAISAGWVLQLAQDGAGLPAALLGGLVVALAVGVINGIVVAFLEVPPLLATLAMSSIIYGVGRSTCRAMPARWRRWGRACCRCCCSCWLRWSSGSICSSCAGVASTMRSATIPRLRASPASRCAACR